MFLTSHATIPPAYLNPFARSFDFRVSLVLEICSTFDTYAHLFHGFVNGMVGSASSFASRFLSSYTVLCPCDGETEWYDESVQPDYHLVPTCLRAYQCYVARYASSVWNCSTNIIRPLSRAGSNERATSHGLRCAQIRVASRLDGAYENKYTGS